MNVGNKNDGEENERVDSAWRGVVETVGDQSQRTSGDENRTRTSGETAARWRVKGRGRDSIPHEETISSMIKNCQGDQSPPTPHPRPHIRERLRMRLSRTRIRKSLRSSSRPSRAQSNNRPSEDIDVHPSHTESI